MKLLREYGIYVNEKTVILRREEDFHFTTDINIMWEKSEQPNSYIGMTSSYAALDLHLFFKERFFARFIIHVRHIETYEALLFIQYHKKFSEKIFVACSPSGEPISSEQWIENIRTQEEKNARLECIRKKALLFLGNLYRSGIKIIELDAFFHEYTSMFGDSVRKDDLLKAMALRYLRVVNFYAPAKKNTKLHVKNILKNQCIATEMRLKHEDK